LAKTGQIQAKSGSGAASRLLRGPIFYFQGSEQDPKAGVLFAVLYTCKEQRKMWGGADSNPQSSKKSRKKDVK